MTDTTIEVRVRTEGREPYEAIPAFRVPWDRLDEARKVFATWSTNVLGVEPETVDGAWGTIVLREGANGEVWFEVMLSDD